MNYQMVDVDGFRDAVHAVERENFRPGDALDAFDRAMLTDGYQLWVNDERTVLVRRWAGGGVEVCTREHPGAIWSPPIVVKPERVT